MIYARQACDPDNIFYANKPQEYETRNIIKPFENLSAIDACIRRSVGKSSTAITLYYLLPYTIFRNQKTVEKFFRRVSSILSETYRNEIARGSVMKSQLVFFTNFTRSSNYSTLCRQRVLTYDFCFPGRLHVRYGHGQHKHFP